MSTEPIRRLAFATLVYPGQWEFERQTVLLVESVRTWGGKEAEAAIAVLVPGSLASLGAGTRRRLDAQHVHMVPFVIDPAARAFPFATKTVAAGAAESWALGTATCLAWMDPCVVVREPVPWLLPSGVALGVRPVDLALIGSRWRAPLDEFWQAIYRDCGVDEERVFSCTSSVDEARLRAYWNAGLLVVRPERGVLSAWAARFQDLYGQPRYRALCAQDEHYRIFLHQAVLAGVILAALRQVEVADLGPDSNYPLHLHERYPTARRPTDLRRVISFRYEELFDRPDWAQKLPAGEPLKGWLEQQRAAK